MANLYNKAGLVNIPVGYQDGFLYNIKPQDNTLGFRFNRDSAATRVNKEGLIEQVGYFGPELVQNGNFSELGSELIVNGDFATDSNWNVGTGGVITNGELVFSSQNTSGTFQTISHQVGKTYKVSVEIKSVSNGSVRLDLAGGGATTQNFSTVGIHTGYVTPVQGGSFFIRTNAFTGSIDNVSVKEVGQNWEFLNAELTDNAVILGQSDGSISQVGQTGILTVGKMYKLSYDILEDNGGNFSLAVPLTTLPTTLGSHYIYFNATGNDLFIKRSSSSTTTKTTFTNISVQEIQGDKPRIDYTDSLDSPSFLLEPQSTNLVTYSEDFDNASWNKFNSVGSSTPIISSNYGISPDGTQNADRIQVSRGSDLFDYSSVYKSITIPSSSRYSSVWLKSLSGTPTIVIGLVSQKITTEWVRYEFDLGVGTFTELSLGVSGAGYISGVDERADFLAWGYQLEAASYPTSYIPTAGSTATRAQETCKGAGSASTFNSTEGVLYAEIAALANDGTYRRISITDGTGNNRINISYHPSTNYIQSFGFVNGVLQFNFTLQITPSTTSFNKIAVKFKENDAALWLNGVEIATDNSVNTWANNTLNDLSFANSSSSSAESFYGNVRSVAVFTEALTDDELQQLTGPDYNSFAALAAAYNYTII